MTDILTPAFIVSVLAAAVAAGTAILFACLGELITERAGVLNLGIEGSCSWVPSQASGPASGRGTPGSAQWRRWPRSGDGGHPRAPVRRSSCQSGRLRSGADHFRQRALALRPRHRRPAAAEHVSSRRHPHFGRDSAPGPDSSNNPRSSTSRSRSWLSCGGTSTARERGCGCGRLASDPRRPMPWALLSPGCGALRDRWRCTGRLGGAAISLGTNPGWRRDDRGTGLDRRGTGHLRFLELPHEPPSGRTSSAAWKRASSACRPQGSTSPRSS